MPLPNSIPILVSFIYVYIAHCGCQVHTTHTGLQGRVEHLSIAVNAAEDGVFAAFCQNIGVSNIREYEERQLKVAQEESQARLRFDTRIARLRNQYVFLCAFFRRKNDLRWVFCAERSLRMKVLQTCESD